MSAATSSSSSSPPTSRPPSHKFQLHDNLFKSRVITFPPEALENGRSVQSVTPTSPPLPTTPSTPLPTRTPASPVKIPQRTIPPATDSISQIPQQTVPPMPKDAPQELLEAIGASDDKDGRDFVERKSSELLRSLRQSTKGLTGSSGPSLFSGGKKNQQQQPTAPETEAPAAPEKPFLATPDIIRTPVTDIPSPAADDEPQQTVSTDSADAGVSEELSPVSQFDTAEAAGAEDGDEDAAIVEGPRWYEFWKPKPYTEADQTWIDPSGGKRPKIPTVNTPENPLSPRDPSHRFRVDDWKRRKGDRLWRPDLPDTLLPEQPPHLPPEELPEYIGHPATRYTGFSTPIPKSEYLKQLQLHAETPLQPLKRLNKYPMEPPIEELPEFPEPEQLPLDATRKDLWEDPHPRELGPRDLPDLDFYPSVQVEPEHLEIWLETRRRLADLEKTHNPFGQYVFGDLKGVLGLQGSDFEVQKQWMQLSEASRSELIRTNWKLTELMYCGRSLGRVEKCKELAHDPYEACLSFIKQYINCTHISDKWLSKHCQADHVAFMDAVYNIEDFKTVSVAFREMQKCFAMPSIADFAFWAR